MKKLLIFLLIVVILCVVPTVLVLGYFGFIPGISKAMKTNANRDLGIVYSEENYTKVEKELALKWEALPEASDKTAEYKGKKLINDSFTSEFLTAALMVNAKRLKAAPYTSAQVRINNDGTAEGSMLFTVPRIKEYATYLGIPAKDVEEGLKLINMGGAQEIPVYLKGTFNVKNNDLTVNITNAEIGRFPVPTSFVTEYQGLIEELIEERFKSIPNVNIESAEIIEGKLKVKGTIPEEIRTKVE